MKNQALFSSKDKIKKIKCRLLQLFFFFFFLALLGFNRNTSTSNQLKLHSLSLHFRGYIIHKRCRHIFPTESTFDNPTSPQYWDSSANILLS